MTTITFTMTAPGKPDRKFTVESADTIHLERLGKSVPHDVFAYADSGLAAIWQYGDGRIHRDACGGKDLTDAEREAKYLKRVDMLKGVVAARTRSVTGDPVEREARRLARDAIQASSGWAKIKGTSPTPKDRESDAHKKWVSTWTAKLAELETKNFPAKMELAKANIAAREADEIDLGE